MVDSSCDVRADMEKRNKMGCVLRLMRTSVVSFSGTRIGAGLQDLSMIKLRNSTVVEEKRCFFLF